MKAAKLIALSALMLIGAGGALAQAGPPTVRVAVIQVPNPAVTNPDPAKPDDWLYKVRPATVVLDRDTKFMWVTNYTDLEMTVEPLGGFPADGKPTPPTEVPDSKRKRSVVKFKDLKADKIDGVFDYKVTLTDKAGKSREADGESAPRVIIDP